MRPGVVVVDDTVLAVDPDQWHPTIEQLVAEGHTFLHGLDAVDELGREPVVRITCRLWRFAGHAFPESVRVETRIPRGDTPHLAGRLASVRDLVPGAAWYEREIHDFFGIGFDPAGAAGSPADPPLLNHNEEIHPLRKDFVLASRVATPWPGAKEPGEEAAAPSRRRMAPAGVPDPQVWGRRDPADPPPSPEDVAASLAGGRVRRRP